MQFIDLNRQYERIKETVDEGFSQVLAKNSYINGPQVRELEQRLAQFVGIGHALACSSGTDALVIPLMAFGLRRDDAVFVPSFTFFASAEAISLAGGTPVFVDCDPVTFNIDPKALEESILQVQREGKLWPRGIISVDLFGQPASYSEIEAIAEEYDLFLLEDAAQAFGSTYKGYAAGRFGDAAATSFFPAKPLGCYGDGGAIFTNVDEMAELCGSIREHGKGIDKYDNVRIGLNGRLDTLQAVVLLAKLDIFNDEIKRRQAVAAAYEERLKDILVTPQVLSDRTSVWAQYTLCANDSEHRDRIIEHLKASGIPTAIYYRTPIHLSTAYAHLGYERDMLPVCELLSERVFSIPMHPYLEEKEIEMITQAIREVC